jgi:hypothetical protein
MQKQVMSQNCQTDLLTGQNCRFFSKSWKKVNLRNSVACVGRHLQPILPFEMGKKFEITKFEISKFKISKFEITKFEWHMFDILKVKRDVGKV